MGMRLQDRIPTVSGADGFRFVWGLFLALLIATMFGCAGVPLRVLSPTDVSSIEGIAGIPDARIWGDEFPAHWHEILAEVVEQFRTDAEVRKIDTIDYLPLSGGGADGAFGAGVLVGWTAAGDRPEFRVVTGISTGALIAPFAFLGSRYDGILKKFYTTTSTKDIITKRYLITILRAAAVASTKPLQRILKEIVTPEVVSEIAAEYSKGRRLLIGATSLDAGRPVVWRIGAIAASGHPDAPRLIRQVMLASASVPGAFPPVYIKVQAGARQFNEMHVDFGVTNQLFMYHPTLNLDRVATKIDFTGQQRFFIIRNSRLTTDFKLIRSRLQVIAGRSIALLIKYQGIGDLYRVYISASRDGIDYNLASIPADFDKTPKESFDPDYMTELFELGYRMAAHGYPWQKQPPGMEKTLF